MHEKNWPKTVEARRRRVSGYLKEFGVASRALEEAKNSEPKSEFEHRAYQLEAWANIWEARQKGKKSALLHLATGLGKTSVAVFDVMKFRKEHADIDSEQLPKILFVCHQNNILEQAKERFEEFIPETTSGFFRTGQNDLPQSDITFGTFQSLRNELDALPPDYFDYIIYDEAHHSQADTFSDVVEHFTPEFQLALTATPNRLDDKNITDHFGEPVYSKTLPEAMSEGWLAQVDYHIVFDDAVKEAIENDFDVESLGKLRQLMNVPPRNEVIAKNILEKRHEIGLDDAKTIVFCEDIEHSEEMAKLLGGKAYHSEVSKETQKRRLKNFRNGELQIITTRDMFNEGVDIPDARLIVFLRSTASKTVFLQQLGRGLRKHKGKDTVSVLDFAANIERLQMVEELANEMREVKLPTRRPGDNGILYDGFSGEDSKQEDGVYEKIIGDEGLVGEAITWHGNVFEFETKAMDILEKYKEIQEKLDRRDINSLTSEELVTLALTLKPAGPLRTEEIAKLSKEGKFVSVSEISVRFGGVVAFQEACGFSHETLFTNDQIIEMALRIKDKDPLTTREISNLAQEGEFVGISIITKQFGSIIEFQKACGFDVVDTKSMTNDEIVKLAKKIKPLRPLTKKEIIELSRKGKFVSDRALRTRFGGVKAFHVACGFEIGKVNTKLQVGKMSNEELVALAQYISPQEPLGYGEIEKLSKAGEFASIPTLMKRFGSLVEFRKACGFEIEQRSINGKKMTNEEIIVLAKELKSSGSLDSTEIEALSKEGKFVSVSTIGSRFGSIKAFRKEYDPNYKDWSEVTNKDVVKIAKELSNGEPFSRRKLGTLSKVDKLPGESFIKSRFGSVVEFNRACGF